ncbi:hypothetical protein Tco_1463143, partial [Tanacetum coccineum]
MLHKAPRLLEELEQSLLLDRRGDIPYRCGLACKRDKEDPHAHIRYFNKITSTLRYPNVPTT